MIMKSAAVAFAVVAGARAFETEDAGRSEERWAPSGARKLTGDAWDHNYNSYSNRWNRYRDDRWYNRFDNRWRNNGT